MNPLFLPVLEHIMPGRNTTLKFSKAKVNVRADMTSLVVPYPYSSASFPPKIGAIVAPSENAIF